MNYQQVLALIQQFIVANGNNEITANVLRPILEAILAQPNELIGDLGDLQTNDQTDLVSAINEVLGVIYPPIGSVNTKIHPLSLFGIDPDLPELTKIAEAVKLQGPFTCNAGQQMVFRTTSTVGTQENGSVVTRYYRLLRNLTTIGGVVVGEEILPSWFMPDGVSEYANPEEDGTIIELGDIGTSEVWDVFNLGNNGDAWDMNEYRFVRATQNADIQLWAFVGTERYYGGPDMGVEPDIFEAFESDFFLITDQPEEPIPFPDLSTGLEAIDEGNGIGWRLKGANPDNYGNIGLNAVDLGSSDSPSTTVGATGAESTVGGGYQNEASGPSSTVGGGFRNEASGDQSTVGGGVYNEASGDNATVGGGILNIAKTFGEFLAGLYATIKEGSATSWIGTDRIFGIGNGTSESERSDAFNVYKNGIAELPSVTNALIDAAGAKTIPTKEWVQEQGVTLEGYHETGTRAGGDLEVVIGDWDDSDTGEKITFKQDGSLELTNASTLSAIKVENEGEFYSMTLFHESGERGAFISGGGHSFFRYLHFGDMGANFGTLGAALLTEPRGYEFPDKEGTVALLEDITDTIIIVITPLGEVLETGDVEYTFTAPYNFTLSNYWISAQVAPIGSGITVRLKVNGTYIDSTGTTIPTGDYDSLTSLPTITTPNIEKGDRITAEITAVGSTYEGEGLTLYLES